MVYNLTGVCYTVCAKNIKSTVYAVYKSKGVFYVS